MIRFDFQIVLSDRTIKRFKKLFPTHTTLRYLENLKGKEAEYLDGLAQIGLVEFTVTHWGDQEGCYCLTKFGRQLFSKLFNPAGK